MKTRANCVERARIFARRENSRTSSRRASRRKAEIELRVAAPARSSRRRHRDCRSSRRFRAAPRWPWRIWPCEPARIGEPHAQDARDFVLQSDAAVSSSPAASHRDARNRRRRQAMALAAAKPPSYSAKAAPVSTSTSAMSCTWTSASARADARAERVDAPARCRRARSRHDRRPRDRRGRDRRASTIRRAAIAVAHAKAVASLRRAEDARADRLAPRVAAD